MNMHRLLSKLRLPLLAIASAVAGCSSGPKVPNNAQLLWFGNSSVNVNVDDLPSGTFYIVDDGSGDTVSAIYHAGGNNPVSWSGLKAGRKYRLYFAPGPRLGKPPATQPAN